MEKSNVTLPLNQAIPLFEENLGEIRAACVENAQAIIGANTPYAVLDVDQPITIEAIRQHVNHLRIQQQAAPILKTIRRIDSYRYFKANPNTNLPVSDTDIQEVREADADWFIDEANLSTRKTHKGVCPFHDDKDPSLMLMKSKQTGKLYLKCWVCNKAWDAPGFIMARDNLSFIEAVKFIKGI